jgi:hypothetical protein
MKGKHKIGTLEIDQIIKIERKASREIELMNATGWTARHKVHKSAKEYNRKEKHKNARYN